MPNQIDEIIDFKQFFFKIIKNWFLFAMFLFFSFAIAFAYNRYTPELFIVETSVLIKEGDSMPTASDLLYEKVPFNKKSLENKELLIKSFPIVNKTLKDLRFDIAYCIEGNIKVTETFYAPIIVNCANTSNIKGKEFKVHVIDDSSFALIDVSSINDRVLKFNEDFIFKDVVMNISYNTNFAFDENIELPVTVVKFHDFNSLTQSYQKKITVSQKERESTVINISILTQDQNKGIAFLNKLSENFIENDLNEKNIASQNTVKFINDQLIEMSDSLSLIEQQIQEYKNNNQITDLSLKAQSIYTNIVGLETELAKSKTI
jgi:uncharacterized protein involved in exopolysaccharide biosynthesis